MERFLENGRSSVVNIYNDCLKTNYNLAVTSTSVNFSFTPEKELPQIFQRNKNKIKKLKTPVTNSSPSLLASPLALQLSTDLDEKGSRV